MRKKTNKKKERKLARKRAPQCETIETDIFMHALRHGLTAIKWSLKMILSGDFGELTEEQKRIIEKTLREDEKLLSDTDGPTEEKAKLNKTLFDLKEVLQSIIEACREKTSTKKISVTYEASPQKITFLGDREKIKIAIQNILDNAIKYSYENGKIVVRLSSDGSDINLAIRDFGIGVPADQQNKIFTKFFRANNAGKTDGDGSGLGLFISKSIIDAHGGRISFSSKENEGSSFNVRLPA